MTDENNNVIDLEDLIAETEQKILNNEYYEDCEVTYKDAIIKVRVKPISQADLTSISKNKAVLNNAGVYAHILQKCILNKNNNKPFTLEQINKLFTGGLATTLAVKCMSVSGIELDNRKNNERINF